MRVLLLLMLGLCLPCFLAAQSRFSGGVSAQIGLSGKDNMKSWPSDALGLIGTHYKEGNYFVPVIGSGLWANYQFNNVIHLRTGLQYVNTGNSHFRETRRELVSTGQPLFTEQRTFRFRVQQLQMPVEFRLRLFKTKLRPALIVGAQFSHDWIRTINAECPILIGSDYRYHSVRWNLRDTGGFGFHERSTQPVIGVALHLNDFLSVAIRHAWVREPLRLSWEENGWITNAPISILPPCSGTRGGYGTRSTHRQSTTINLEYRLF